MLSLMQILMVILDVMWFFVIAHVIMSWLINFQVLNLHQQFVAQIWYGLNRILEPAYSRIRDFLPQMGGLDLRHWWPCWGSMRRGLSSRIIWRLSINLLVPRFGL